MHSNFQRLCGVTLMAIVTAPFSLSAQHQTATDPIIVEGVPAPPAPLTGKGPDIKGIISARSGDKLKVKGADGTAMVIMVNDATRIKTGGGIFRSRTPLTTSALLNGLPVTIKTLQSADGLVASQVIFRGV